MLDDDIAVLQSSPNDGNVSQFFYICGAKRDCIIILVEQNIFIFFYFFFCNPGFDSFKIYQTLHLP